MDFDKLFTLLVEADEPTLPAQDNEGDISDKTDITNTDGTGAATPENYDVEPAPSAPAVNHGENAQSIKSYIDKLASFADELNSPNGNSLNDYINEIESKGGIGDENPYKNISTLSKKVISAAQDLRSLIEDLNGFRIAAQKKASTPKPVVPGPASTPAPTTPAPVA